VVARGFELLVSVRLVLGSAGMASLGGCERPLGFLLGAVGTGRDFWDGIVLGEGLRWLTPPKNG
jgi:hypothetical protein